MTDLSLKFSDTIKNGYAFSGPTVILGSAMYNKAVVKDVFVRLPLKMMNRHGLIAGATGTGKTYTMASVIAAAQRPALIMAHNKTLAAQLCQEFRAFFPENAVEFFISYYDYYQPEAYVPGSDLYIAKDSSSNEEIERLRHAATQSLLQRARNAGAHLGALCEQIHRQEGEPGVRRVLGVLALARKHGATVAEEAAQAALELGLPTYRFLRRYLERRTHVPLTLKQVDPLIRQLSIYRDLIDQKTGDLS